MLCYGVRDYSMISKLISQRVYLCFLLLYWHADEKVYGIRLRQHFITSMTYLLSQRSQHYDVTNKAIKYS